jgi:hypothetical protein
LILIKIKELQDLENKYPEYFDANSPSQQWVVLLQKFSNSSSRSSHVFP